MTIITNLIHQVFSHVGPFILLLGLLIFVHELGHFLVAKFFKIRVEIFSLGFGKKIFQYKRGDTNYCISWIPLGGYVKMFGDDPSVEIPEEQKKFSFLHKPVGPRIAVVLAGPLMNLFFAIFLYSMIAMIGEQTIAPVLGDIAPDSAAYQAGFRSGDKIAQIDEVRTQSWNQVQEVISNSAGKNLSFTVARESSAEEAKVVLAPSLGKSTDVLSSNENVWQIAGLVTESLASLVGVTDSTSAAAKVGIESLDAIVKINNTEVNFFRQIEPLLAAALASGEKLNLVVKSSGDEKAPERAVVLDLPTLQLDASKPLLAQLGLESAELYLYKIKPKSPADRVGLKIKDRILRLNGQAMNSWQDVVGIVKNYSPASGEIDFVVSRSGQEMNLKIKPEMTELLNASGKEEQRFTVGVVSGFLLSTNAPVTIKTGNPIQALKLGLGRSVEVSRLIILGLVKLVQGEISARNVGGVITIGRFASKSFQVGIASFLAMMAFISINLFLVNLLPVPILDGGHLLFFTIEALRGTPLSMRKMEVAQQIGLFLLMSLMAFALFNDINNLFNAW